MMVPNPAFDPQAPQLGIPQMIPRFPQVGPRVCADAAPITAEHRACFPQYVTYQVNAGRAFVVTGTSTGMLTPGGQEVGGQCVPNELAEPKPVIDPRIVSRIPIDVDDLAAQQCALPADPAAFNNFATAPVTPQEVQRAEALLQVVRPPLDKANPVPTPNPCYFKGGPSPLDSGMDRNMRTHLRARFQNTQIAFVLTNFDRVPVTQTSYRLDVRGGVRAQTVLAPATTEISLPARLVLGPIDALNKEAERMYEAPYLFVVDQRRLNRAQAGGATRGQLVRIHPLGYEGSKGFQPIVEDFQRSGGLFPIQ
jgi:hypothetical protein